MRSCSFLRVFWCFDKQTKRMKWNVKSHILRQLGWAVPSSVQLNPTTEGVQILWVGRGWDPMLQNVILKPIKVRITCTNLDSYLVNWVRFWDFKIWQKWDFAPHCCTKIAITLSIYEIQGSSFGCIPLFECLKILFCNLGSTTNFK